MLKFESGGSKPNILLLMSGSIACVKAASLISEWVKRGCKVRVACTRSVKEFIGHSALQGLGAGRVFDNVFTPGQAMEHISLGKWADVIVAAPATSNLINKLSVGIADDAVSTVWQAAYGQGKPMVIVPAMNTRMWRYPATRKNVQQLRQWGIHVLPVASGALACGEQGEGRMLEPVEILKLVDQLLIRDPDSPGKHILITAGGTRERIDSVRFIGNMSSGRTAAGLADELVAAGHAVTWLGAEDAMRPTAPIRTVTYYGFADLATHLKDLLGTQSYDAVIHAAAVSDFSVSSIENHEGRKLQGLQGKISSEAGLLLRLKPNPKLLSQLKTWSKNPGLQVIGFKLTDTPDRQQRIAAVKKQLDHSGVDAVVHNDLSEISKDNHTFCLHAPTQKPVHCQDSKALARSIDKMMEVV